MHLVGGKMSGGGGKGDIIWPKYDGKETGLESRSNR
jgi:hypothetical protein